MILVTGANGHLGRLTVEQLAAGAGEGRRYAVSVRDPAKAGTLAERGIEVRQGDFDLPESLDHAFAGVDRLVLISTDGPRDVRIRQHRNAIDAAKRAGVQRIVYTSFIDVAADSPADFAAVHRVTEAELQNSGAELAILRNPLYADYLPMTLGNALESGVFYLPAGKGRTSFLGRDELARATAAAVSKDRLEQEIYELTGPAAYSYDEVAAAVSRITGKPVRYESIPEAAYAEALVGYGVPDWMAHSLANMYAAVAAGNFDRVSDDYSRLTGQEGRSLDEQVRKFLT